MKFLIPIPDRIIFILKNHVMFFKGRKERCIIDSDYSVKIALLCLLLPFLSCHGLTQDKGKVHLTGNFLGLPGGKIICVPLHIDQPLENDKLDLWIDDVQAGVYALNITYPFEPGKVIPIPFMDNNTGAIKYLKEPL